MKCKPSQPLGNVDEVAPTVEQESRPVVRVGMRVARIIGSASADMVELVRTEQAQFPRVARLLMAIKQAAAKVSIELVSLAISYPAISAVAAVLVFCWFYVSAKVEAHQ